MIFILDNFDSFTYNIFQLTQALGFEAMVKRAQETSIQELRKLSPKKIILSPGPGKPKDHPFLFEVLETFQHDIPILGICLGMQAMNEFFGGTLKCDAKPMHGKTSGILHDGSPLFADIPSPFAAARYHSLIIDALASTLTMSAWEEKQHIPMALQHKSLSLFGVQFHPESFLTSSGSQLLKNFYFL